MDALLSTLLAVALAEQGERMQLLARASATRFGRPGRVATGLILAGFAISLIAAVAGALTHDLVPFRALTLLVALALLSAGVTAILRVKPPAVIAYPTLGAFGGPAFAAFVLGVGGGAQFLTFALAARADSIGLAAIGATLGWAAAILPAVLAPLPTARTMRAIRLGIATLFLIAGGFVALGALRLI